MAMTGFCKNQHHQKPAKVLVGDRLDLPLQSSQFKSTLECDHLGSRRLINVLLTKWIQKFAIGTSVTIWPDYLCNIWSFTAMKICPKAKFLYQSRLHILPNTKKPSKNCQRLLKFCQIWSHWTARRVYPFEQRKRCSEGGLRDRQRPQQRAQRCLIWRLKGVSDCSVSGCDFPPRSRPSRSLQRLNWPWNKSVTVNYFRYGVNWVTREHSTLEKVLLYVRLVSSFTSLNSTASQQTNNDIFSFLVESILL